MAKDREDTTSTPLTRTELNDYIVFHAHKLTMQDVRTVAERLPQVRQQFSEVKAPDFPSTPQRLAFLASVVESFATGKADDMPFESVAEAAFALIYLSQEMDLIPDSLPAIGYMDDAMIVALILERNAPAFLKFAESHGQDWSELHVTASIPQLP